VNLHHLHDSLADVLTLYVDYAERNAPPTINYGVVYPQAILKFVVATLYSVHYPPIVIFGAIYFGTAYVGYKYKLLFGESMSQSLIIAHA
jgi:hypothetical protein